MMDVVGSCRQMLALPRKLRSRPLPLARGPVLALRSPSACHPFYKSSSSLDLVLHRIGPGVIHSLTDVRREDHAASTCHNRLLDLPLAFPLHQDNSQSREWKSRLSVGLFALIFLAEVSVAFHIWKSSFQDSSEKIFGWFPTSWVVCHGACGLRPLHGVKNLSSAGLKPASTRPWIPSSSQFCTRCEWPLASNPVHDSPSTLSLIFLCPASRYFATTTWWFLQNGNFSSPWLSQ